MSPIRHSAPRPGSGRPAARPGRGRALIGSALGVAGRFCRKRPGVIAGILAVIGCGGAVGWNALTQQPTRHPAPLFGRAGAMAEPPRRPELSAAPAPLPVRRPDPSTFAGLAPPVPLSPPSQEPAARPVAANDPIGAIIRASEGGARPEPQRVILAQKALTRLGYGPLRPDGQMGATTRQALEQFERDQKLPLTGALGPRTIRQLASMSGTQIE